MQTTRPGALTPRQRPTRLTLANPYFGTRGCQAAPQATIVVVHNVVPDDCLANRCLARRRQGWPRRPITRLIDGCMKRSCCGTSSRLQILECSHMYSWARFFALLMRQEWCYNLLYITLKTTKKLGSAIRCCWQATTVRTHKPIRAQQSNLRNRKHSTQYALVVAPKRQDDHVQPQPVARLHATPGVDTRYYTRHTRSTARG